MLYYQCNNLEQVQQVQLYDATGRLWRESAQITGQFSLEGMPPGLYYFMLHTAGGSMHKRILKQ